MPLYRTDEDTPASTDMVEYQGQPIETVTTRPKDPKPVTRYRGLSPLQAGLIYGGGAATVMGPLGILIGLGAGIMAKSQRDSFMSRETAAVSDMHEYNQALINQVDHEMQYADPEQQRYLQSVKLRLANSEMNVLHGGDLAGNYAELQQAQTMTEGVMTATRDTRIARENTVMAARQGMYTSNMGKMRDEYAQAVENNDTAQTAANQALDFIANHTEDELNQPLNRSHLYSVISIATSAFRDTPDMADAVSAAGRGVSEAGHPLAVALGAVMETGSAVWKASEAKIKKEDVNKIVMNIADFSRQHASNNMDRIARATAALDAWGQETKILAPNQSGVGYVTGTIDHLDPFTSKPVYTPPTMPARPTPTRAIGTSPQTRQSWQRTPATARGGVNFLEMAQRGENPIGPRLPTN